MGLLTMDLQGEHYTADILYDGLIFKLMEPFLQVDQNSIFAAKPETPTSNDEYEFSELDVRILCESFAENGG